jgi:hypothetical protein
MFFLPSFHDIFFWSMSDLYFFYRETTDTYETGLFVVDSFTGSAVGV